MSQEYVHGYSQEEQLRLVEQSKRWSWLIEDRLDYQPGQRVLEIGCAAGTTLGVLAGLFPGIQVAGLDINEAQINFAKKHLASLGVTADLQLGNALQLPWEDESFDHVFMMWFIEHLADPLAALAEAKRVLKPGGTISIIETDYRTYQVAPANQDFQLLIDSLSRLFDQTGNASIGLELGALLYQQEFKEIENKVYPLHYYSGLEAEEIISHVEYTLEFIEIMVPDMVSKLGVDDQKLQAGVKHLRSIATIAGGAMTHLMYKAVAVKAN